MKWIFLSVLFGFPLIILGQFIKVDLPTSGVINTIFCDGAGCIASDNLDKVYFSDDFFESWTSISVPLTSNENKLKFIKASDTCWYYLIGSGFLHRILKTLDAGETWDTLITIPGAIHDFAISSDSILLAVGSFGKAFLSYDQGETWDDLSSGFGQDFIVEFFGDSSLIIGGFQSTFTTLNLFASGFGASTGPGYFSRSIAFNGAGASFLATSTNQLNQARIYKSTNWGDTWQKKTPFLDNYNIWQLAFQDSLIGYASGKFIPQDTGMVFTTIDGGETWNTSVRVPTNRQLLSIAVANDTTVLIGATGGKLFRWNPKQWTTDLASASPPFSLSLQPNPASATQQLFIQSDHYGQATISIYDMSGRLVKQIPSSIITPGEQAISIDLSSWPAGIYVYRVEMNGEYVTLKGQKV